MEQLQFIGPALLRPEDIKSLLQLLNEGVSITFKEKDKWNPMGRVILNKCKRSVSDITFENAYYHWCSSKEPIKHFWVYDDYASDNERSYYKCKYCGKGR